MLIMMYIYHEFSYDAHQKLADRLYQIGTRGIQNGEEIRAGYTVAPLAPAMQREFPEIQQSRSSLNDNNSFRCCKVLKYWTCKMNCLCYK